MRAQVALQHRGQHAAGFAIQTEEGLQGISGFGLIREIVHFDSLQYHDQPTLWTIGHNRYETQGGKNENNIQPIIIKTAGGETLVVAHNGEFVLDESLTKYQHDPHVSDTYMVAHLLANTAGQTWTERVLRALHHIRGAYSLIIGVGDELFITRDPFGFRPLIFGQISNGWMAASETHAFDKVFEWIPGKIVRMVKRGEVVRITRDGPQTVQEGCIGPAQTCMFEAPYLAFPTSRVPTYEYIDDDNFPDRWKTNAWFRRRMGKVLAQEDPVSNASFVIGLPDSGLFAAEAYAEELHLPLRHHVIRDHYSMIDRRSFMSDDLTRQGEGSGIDRVAFDRLSFELDSETWLGKIVVMIDDSNVRGKVGSTMSRMLRMLGVAELHGRYAYPMIRARCNKGVSMRTNDELIAYRYSGNLRDIAKKMGLKSIAYITPAGYVRAMRPGVDTPQGIGTPLIFILNNLCGQCVSGIDPVGEFTLPAARPLQRQTARP